MAGPQPNENIPFGADMFRSVKSAMSQVQALKKEIRTVDRDLAKVGKAVKGVEKFDPLHKELLGKRRDLAEKIRMNEKLIEQQGRIHAGAQRVNQELKQQARDVKMFKALTAMHTIQDITRRGIDANTVGQLLTISDRTMTRVADFLERKGGAAGSIAGKGLGAIAGVMNTPQGILTLMAAQLVQQGMGTPEQIAENATTREALDHAADEAYISPAVREKLCARAKASILEDQTLIDNPHTEGLILAETKKRLSALLKRQNFLDKLNESEINDLLGTALTGAESAVERRGTIAAALSADGGRAMGRVSNEMRDRDERARAERQRVDLMNEQDRFQENEKKKFADIAWKLRRNPTELLKGGGFMAHGRYAY